MKESCTKMDRLRDAIGGMISKGTPLKASSKKKISFKKKK